MIDLFTARVVGVCCKNQPDIFHLFIMKFHCQTFACPFHSHSALLLCYCFRRQIAKLKLLMLISGMVVTSDLNGNETDKNAGLNEGESRSLVANFVLSPNFNGIVICHSCGVQKFSKDVWWCRDCAVGVCRWVDFVVLIVAE